MSEFDAKHASKPDPSRRMRMQVTYRDEYRMPQTPQVVSVSVPEDQLPDWVKVSDVE